MKKQLRSLARIIICVLVCALLLSVTAFANGAFDADFPNRLAIQYQYNGAAVAEAHFDLYRVGELAEDGTLSLSGIYAAYNVALNGLTNEEFQAAADTLYGYILRDDCPVDFELTTDAAGSASVSGLDCGLYLLAGDARVDGATTYITSPMLLTLPTNNTHDGEWSHDVTVMPKCSAQPTFTALKVLKVWEDKGYEASRPAEVVVNLLKDGEVYETIKLSDDNSWRYTWEALDANASWTVVEEINADYTVSVKQEGVTYVITNTYKQPPPPPTPTPTPPSIPQTGLVWWPVPVLLIAGAALIAVGLLGRKEHGDET